jgi:hypothetical protein
MKAAIYKRLTWSPIGVDTNHRSRCSTACPFDSSHIPVLGSSQTAPHLLPSPKTGRNSRHRNNEGGTEPRTLLWPVKDQGCIVWPGGGFNDRSRTPQVRGNEGWAHLRPMPKHPGATDTPACDQILTAVSPRNSLEKRQIAPRTDRMDLRTICPRLLGPRVDR